MHCMDANKTYGEKAWRQLHKNVASNIEQVLEAAPHKAAAVRPPITHHKTIKIRQTRHAGHYWRSKDELVSDVLLRTPSHGRAKAGRPDRTYIHQLCADSGCNPEDLPEAMDDREGWQERVRDIRDDGTTWWWWWWWRWYNKIHKMATSLYRKYLIWSLAWIKWLVFIAKSLKLPRLFNFYFQVFVLTYCTVMVIFCWFFFLSLQ